MELSGPPMKHKPVKGNVSLFNGGFLSVYCVNISGKHLKLLYNSVYFSVRNLIFNIITVKDNTIASAVPQQDILLTIGNLASTCQHLNFTTPNLTVY